MSEVISMMFPTIRTLREGRNWTQQQVADMLYLNRRTYCAYENGAIAITPELLIQLAALYQTSVDYLLASSSATNEERLSSAESISLWPVAIATTGTVSRLTRYSAFTSAPSTFE